MCVPAEICMIRLLRVPVLDLPAEICTIRLLGTTENTVVIVVLTLNSWSKMQSVVSRQAPITLE